MPQTLLMEMIVNMNGEKFTENISLISENESEINFKIILLLNVMHLVIMSLLTMFV